MTTNRIPQSAQTPDQILRQITELMSEAEALLVGPTAQDIGVVKADELKEALAAAHVRVADLYRHARRKISASAQAADQLIRAHPYKSLGIALGVGLILGAWSRRDR